MENVLGIENFNIIEDEENYYFIRALNMADNEDLEKRNSTRWKRKYCSNKDR